MLCIYYLIYSAQQQRQGNLLHELWEISCPRSDGCKWQAQKSHPGSLKPELCFHPKETLCLSFEEQVLHQMSAGIAPKRIVFSSPVPWCCDFSPAPSSPVHSFPLLLPLPFFLPAAALLEAKASLTGACFSLGRANNEGICGWQAACQWLNWGRKADSPPAAGGLTPLLSICVPLSPLQPWWWMSMGLNNSFCDAFWLEKVTL